MADTGNTPQPILGTNLASSIVPFTDADKFPTHQAQYGKGGWRSVDDLTARDAIPDERKEPGMVVYVNEIALAYSWNGTDWIQLNLTGGGGGGETTLTRSFINHNVDSLPPEASVSFNLDLGKASIIYNLSVDRPVKVTAWSTPAKDEPNPYIFLATADHLMDDGTTLLSDGTILKTRQYSIFVNLESPATNTIYFDMDSVDSGDGPVTLSLIYMKIE